MTSTLLLESPDRVFAKAWADEEFRAALMANPRETLKSQGIEIPDDVTLNVFENSAKVLNLVLPVAPAMGLMEEPLEVFSEAGRCGGGGGCHCGGCGGCGGCGCGGCAGGGGCGCSCLCLCVCV